MLVVGILLLAFLPVAPASATQEHVIDITDTEIINWQATYAPNLDGTNGSTPIGVVSGTGTITISNNGPITLNDVDIVFNAGTTTVAGWAFIAGSSTATATVTPETNTVDVKVKTFPAGTHVTVSYPIDSSLTSPITLDSAYSMNKVTDGTTSYTDVTLTATAHGTAINSPTITITSANDPSRGNTALPDWALTSTSPGVTANGDNSVLTWSPGNIASETSTQIVFRATVRDTYALDDGTNQMALFDMATSAVTYSITSNTQSSAGVGVASITAMTSEVNSQIDKSYINGQWTFTPAVSIPTSSTDISYELDSVSVWAIDSSSPNTIIAPSDQNPKVIDLTSSPYVFDKSTGGWTASGSQLLTFPYNGIPVGFSKPSIKIYDDAAHTQFTRSYTDGSGSVTLLKQIYVISGYEVQVVKTITQDATTQGLYHISIVATNLGNKVTPPHVYVYDIVPEGFSISAFTSAIQPVNPSNPIAVTTPITGNAYYWDLEQLAAHESKTVTYDVSGSGTYTTSDLYVVGVDPAQSLNLLTMPSLQNVSAIVNSNFESLAALGTAGLLVIGMIGTARRRL